MDLNKSAQFTAVVTFRLERYDGLCHVGYKGLSFLKSGLAIRVFFAQHNFAKNQEDNRKAMLQHPRPRPIEAAWNVLEGVGDAEEGLDPSHLAEIGAPGGPRWPLPCHQGGQLPYLAAARFGGLRGCRSSPPLPLHRSVRSQKMECWSYQ